MPLMKIIMLIRKNVLKSIKLVGPALMKEQAEETKTTRLHLLTSNLHRLLSSYTALRKLK